MEGNVKNRTQAPTDWNPPATRSLVVDRTESHIQIESGSDEHFYVTYKRGDRGFSKPPTESSVSFKPGQALVFTVDADASETMSFSYVVIEYTADEKKTYNYSSPIFLHEVSANAVHITFAVRARGRGRLVLGNLVAESHQQAAGWVSRMSVRGGDKVTLRVAAFATEQTPPGTVLAVAEFTDSSGTVILPVNGSSINPRIGAYKYINHGPLDQPAETLYELEIPPRATNIEFRLIPWKNGSVYLKEEPTVFAAESEAPMTVESIKDFIDRIPAEDTLIVLYTTAPQLGHPTLALRPNRLTEEYLKQGCWVVFFPFSRVSPDTEIYVEKARQYSRERISEFLSAASTRDGKNNVFICSSFPDVVAVGAIDLLSMHGWSTMYEVRDDMEEFNRVGYSKWFHPMLESRVATNVETVVAVSPRLAQKMDIIRRSEGVAHVVPNGVNAEFVDETSANRSLDSYDRRGSSMTVGYIGHLTPSWFDWPLLVSTAENMPEVNFELIGHGFPPDTHLPGNVHYLGPKTHEEFQELALGWKVGLIPFKPSTLTFAVDPNKIYEYLAVGLRTVTARMGSVHLCPSTWIYDEASGFREALENALNGPFTLTEIQAIDDYLGAITWSKRADRMLQILKDDNA